MATENEQKRVEGYYWVVWEGCKQLAYWKPDNRILAPGYWLNLTDYWGTVDASLEPIEGPVTELGLIRQIPGYVPPKIVLYPVSSEACIEEATVARVDNDSPTYIKAKGPPDDWDQYDVIDEDTGELIKGVIEVDCKEGWLKRYVVDGRRYRLDANGALVVERIEGRFKLRSRKK